MTLFHLFVNFFGFSAFIVSIYNGSFCSYGGI